MASYQSDIDRMTWSYSRIKAFTDCPYRWYLRYIRGLPGKDLFFASYGTFLHRLLAQYYKGEALPDQLCKTYLQTFRQAVSGHAPSPAVFSAYFSGGLQYLRCLQPLPYRVLAVEQRLDFQINGIPCVGYVDVLGERDGQLCIIDHKSKQLKPRSRRAKPTKADKVLVYYNRIHISLHLYPPVRRKTSAKTAGNSNSCRGDAVKHDRTILRNCPFSFCQFRHLLRIMSSAVPLFYQTY